MVFCLANHEVYAVHEPLVSVIIPTFRRPELLVRAIASVLTQTYAHWELLVIDDNDAASPARGTTEQVMAGYAADPRIRYLRHEFNQGLPAARNTAIKASSGALIAFLDDDDEWLPTKLQRQVEAFAADALVTLVYTTRHVADSAGTVTRTMQADPKGLIRDRMLEENWIGTPSSVMIRRNALFAAGLFDPRMPSLEDWDLYLRLDGRFALIAEPLTVYYMHDSGRMMDNYGTVANAMGMLYRKHRRELLRKRVVHGTFLGHYGHVHYHAGNRGRARRLILQSLALHPLRRRTQRHLIKATFSEQTLEDPSSIVNRVRRLVRRRRAGPAS
jgi:glycosyltransferase involved in cell wall biosynthesis